MANARDGGDIYDRLIDYRRSRRQFAIRSFLLAAFFILLAAVQWIPLLLVESMKKAFIEYYYISFIVFFCALLTVTVFIFFEEVRFMVPLNWILTLFIVECVIWGLARVIVESKIDLFAYSFAAVALFVVAMLVLGAYLAHDLTLDVIFLFIGSIILFTGAILFVMLDIIANVPHAVYFYLTFVFIMVAMFLMYHSQTIIGGRYAEMRIVDYLLAALIIFHDFVILFVLIFYLSSRIGSNKYESRYSQGGSGNQGQNATTTAKP